MIENINLPTEP